MHSRRSLEMIRWVLAFGALAGIVLVYHRWLHVNPTTVALTLLLLILVLAAEWGLRYAVILSVAATICYNFYFLPPIGGLTISDPQNWLALFALLCTAIIASRLAERARKEAADARGRQRELEVLLRLSRELLQTNSVDALLAEIPAAVASVTGARACRLYLCEGDKLYQAGGEPGSEVEVPHLRSLTTTLTDVAQDAGETQIPLHTGARPTGLLGLKDVTLSPGTASAIGSLVSFSIERAQALENVAKGEAAKESERLRSLMIDSITHELRTPLTSIKGAATALLADRMREEDARELLEIIDEESDRLNRLVAEAVEMAQLDAQQVQMRFATVNARSLIYHALDACLWVQEQHRVVISIDENLNMTADFNVLQKVFCNLLENAAKYSLHGTTITVSADRVNGMIALSIADQGAGIDPAEQGLIFERFYRARSQAEGTSGTGMGLPISRAIVEAHCGVIHVLSQPGQGSVFTVQIPEAPT